MKATARTSIHPGQQQGKRLVRNLLLDRRFQLRWALRVVLATTLIVAVMGYFLYRTIGDATDQLLAQKLGDPSLTKDAVDAFIRQSEFDKLATLGILAAGLFSMVLLFGGLTIVYTHKIAGPIFKMRKLFESIDGNQLQLWAKLRRADELQDFFLDFESMLRRIREQRRADIEVIENLRRQIGEESLIKGNLEALDRLISAYKKSVEMD